MNSYIEGKIRSFETKDFLISLEKETECHKISVIEVATGATYESIQVFEGLDDSVINTILEKHPITITEKGKDYTKIQIPTERDSRKLNKTCEENLQKVVRI